MELIINEKPPTICLNMIVKNEEHIIEDTLRMLCSKIDFSYWVICDTGSTDNTKSIITNFFNDKNIPGELHNHDWKNFAHNRTLALECAYDKTDLVFIFDADDEIHGLIKIPTSVDYDGYLCNFGSSKGISYQRMLLVNNRIKWIYRSVVHEYIHCLKPNAKISNLDGDYYVVSGRKGSRNKDPNKYLNDAKILEEAYYEAKNDNNDIYIRYGFYCANSYKDAGKPEDAIKWYKITLENDNWVQEKYMACYHLYNEYCKIGEKEKGFYYLVESVKYDTERAETIYLLVQYYCCKGLNNIAYQYYNLIKDFYENKYLNSNIDGKLFVEPDKANYLLPYYMILVSDKVKDVYPEANKTIVKMFEIVFTKKYLIEDNFYLGNLLYNLQFFIDLCIQNSPNFINKVQSYIQFLETNNYDLTKYDFLQKFEKYGITYTHLNRFSQEECKKSNKILFYTGFSNLPWNYTYSLTNALGGSETAVINLAKSFPTDYEIFIAGQVEEEKLDNITFVSLNTLRSLIKTTPFHTVIVSRYAGFYEMFPETSFYQSYIWAHDTVLNNYGTNIDVNLILTNNSTKINRCVCQTEWHKNLFLEKYPMLKDKIITINNGIDVSKFDNGKIIKRSNRFVYTSCSERGLSRLLELWPSIVAELPDAELYIASYNKFPHNEFEKQLLTTIQKYDNIFHQGTLNKDDLYKLMATSEYWLYPTNFNETSCITAMEMLMTEVICIYYPVAGLVNTLGEYGIPVKRGEELSTILNLSNKQKTDIKKKGKNYALTCSWKTRAEIWLDKLHLNAVSTQVNDIINIHEENNIDYTIKIVNLNRRSDRKTNMLKKLYEHNITNYEFFEAVDGNLLEPSMFIKKLFKNNDFNYRKGVIGCALSHYKLWQQLSNDEKYSYYVILEDDIEFVDNFNNYLDNCVSIIRNENIQYALLGGYQIEEKLTLNDTISFNKISTSTRCSGAFGYIITKEACRMLIRYLNKNGINRAIDHSGLYTNCVDMFEINKYIVSASAYQIHNNRDTDIQLNYDCLNFDNIPKYTVAFTDWWVDEYCGGTFDVNNNYFTELLSDFYDIKIVSPETNPDILFYSVFGNNHLKLNARRKIFYTGESIPQDQCADYNISFDEDTDNNCRLPIWLCYLNDDIVNDYKNKMENKVKIPEKTKFCSIICQQDNVTNTRSEIVNKLSKYKQVDCGGKFLNNIGYIVPRGVECSGKIEHNNQYKFVIAFENKLYPGYVTEKICDAYKSKSIPIYWGTTDVIKDFNPTTFINANDFSSIDELVEYIIKVDNDDHLYELYFKEPILTQKWLDVLNKNNSYFDMLVQNIVENKNKNKELKETNSN